MPCKPILGLNKEVVGISCTRNGDEKDVCYICKKPMTSLCDATRNDGQPCDLPMCDEHRIKVGPDTDVCKYHNYPKFIEQAKKNRVELEKEKARDFDKMQRQTKMFLDYAKLQNKDVVIKGNFKDLFQDY